MARVQPGHHRLVVVGLVGGALVAGLLALAWVRVRREEARPGASLPADPVAVPRAGPMVWVAGGRFWRGSSAEADAQPIREVEVDGFWIDRTEVTNAEFARFVAATGYVTVAEQVPDPRQYPDADPAALRAGSIVFTPPEHAVDLNQPMSWWSYVPGADWKHPAGPGSSIDDRGNFPVVQVCWDDAAAYARWTHKRLPTEAEWEYAARGGINQAPYVWGNDLKPGGQWPANIWQGRFPTRNTGDDGFAATAPVGSFAPNGFGLYDMAGNVWEWCSDWYRPDAYAAGSSENPTGPSSSYDPDEPGIPKRVQRGGSFLCSDEYCGRYRPGTRGKGEPTSAAAHLGFRCVRSGPGPRPRN